LADFYIAFHFSNPAQIGILAYLFFSFFKFVIFGLFIYLVTPLDIFDHIIHSFDRLLIQILPLFVFAFALQAKEFLMKHKITNVFKNENSLS